MCLHVCVCVCVCVLGSPCNRVLIATHDVIARVWNKSTSDAARIDVRRCSTRPLSAVVAGEEHSVAAFVCSDNEAPVVRDIEAWDGAGGRGGGGGGGERAWTRG